MDGRKLLITFGAVACVAALTSIALLQGRSDTNQGASSATAPPVAVSTNVANPQASADAVVFARGALPSSENNPTLGPLIERLTESARRGNAEDAFRAFTLANRCANLRARRHKIASVGRIENQNELQAAVAASDAVELPACADVSQKQLDDRLENLRRAADFGLDAAAVAFFTIGPAGDTDALVTRPDDPNVIAWRKDARSYLEHAAARGSVDALATLSLAHEVGQVFEKDVAKALLYELVLGSIYRAQEKFSAADARMALVERLEATLSPEERKDVRQQASKFVKNCCAKSG